MLDDILKRADVQRLLHEVSMNRRYYEKKKLDSIDYEKFVSFQQALFIVMDALVKYKIIIDDVYLLDSYISRLDYLMKKIDNFHDVSNGINKIMGKFCAIKLGYENSILKHKKEILSYIYDRYIVNGYLFHSVSDVYVENIKVNGFIPQNYNNLYDKFKQINKIIGNDVMDTDFTNNDVSFTDSFLMAYYYAVNSPMYFSKLLCNNNILGRRQDKTAYFKNDYIGCFNNLNRLFGKLELNDTNEKIIRSICNEEWSLLKKNSAKPVVLLIKRNVLGADFLKDIDDILENNIDDFSVLVGRILDSRYSNIKCDKKLEVTDIEFINLYGYKDLIEEKETIFIDNSDYIDNNMKKENDQFADVYGKVSILLLIGALLITLGVIITIIMLSGRG